MNQIKITLSIILGILLINLASALTITSVSSYPAQIEPGENAKITLEIKNNLDQDIENVEISLDLENVPFAPYQSSSEKTISKIREDKTKDIEFAVMALGDAESGTYKIPVKIRYNETEKISYISLIVNSEPSLEIEYEGNLIKGRNNELTIKIINSGLSDVKSLSIEVSDAVGIQILNSKYVYIGNIDSDDFDSANFKVLVNENAPISVNLPIKLSYRDSLNKVYGENKNIELRTYTEKQATRLGLIKKSKLGQIAISIIILVVLFVIYRKMRKRLRKKREREKKEK
jgi:hypothetical protein